MMLLNLFFPVRQTNLNVKLKLKIDINNDNTNIHIVAKLAKPTAAKRMIENCLKTHLIAVMFRQCHGVFFLWCKTGLYKIYNYSNSNRIQCIASVFLLRHSAIEISTDSTIHEL